MNEELKERLDELELCKRCGCCDTYWEDCWNCWGKGGRDYEYLQEEDPLWYSPGDFEECTECHGAGRFEMCLGKCDENGKHTSDEN
jgi:hypothetical protein